MNPPYPPESIGSVMSTVVPTCSPDQTLKDILDHLTSRAWKSIRNVYVVDANEKLLGYVDLAALIQSDHSMKASQVMQRAVISLHPNDDQEKAVFVAVKDDIVTIPVVGDGGAFLGVVTAHTIVDIMHNEHIEDTLLTVGIHSKGSSVVRLLSERVELIVKSRAPWLLVGLAIGLGLGFISSWFEQVLQKSIALAYFIPVIAYISNSLGTQTQTIVIRALAVAKINVVRYLLRELYIGSILAFILGGLGGLGAMMISQSPQIGLVVFLSLFVASAASTLLAAGVPMAFKRFGKDPALGSGPLATAIQDILSVVIYFLFAMLII